MKKIKAIGIAIVLIFSVGALSAQPPHAKAYGKKKFYYYPQQNVYFDPVASLYIYHNGPSWSSVSVLPPSLVISVGAPRVLVYHEGPEIWYDNPAHVVKYKSYKYKKVKYHKHKHKG